MTSIRLMFLGLAIASFLPVVMSLRPGWWAVFYYGVLFVWWVGMSLATVRWTTAEDHVRDRRIGRSVRRLIIVARGQTLLYGTIRSVSFGDDSVSVIVDRRSTDRRRQLQVFIPDRRRAERRRHNVEPVLLGQGWAEVRLPDEHSHNRRWSD
jgi:hypothetical protein